MFSLFFYITFATSQQYQTYLSTASVWFSHSFELLSLPKSAAQLALLLEWPTPLLGWESRTEGQTMTETENQLEPNTRFCTDGKIEAGKWCIYRKRIANINKIWEIMISSLQLGQGAADIMISLILNFLSYLKGTEHKTNFQIATV